MTHEFTKRSRGKFDTQAEKQERVNWIADIEEAEYWADPDVQAEQEAIEAVNEQARRAALLAVGINPDHPLAQGDFRCYRLNESGLAALTQMDKTTDWEAGRGSDIAVRFE